MDWESKCRDLERLLAEKDQQFEEFQRDSKEYEHELENELRRYEEQKAALEGKRQQLENDNQVLNERLNGMTQKSNQTLNQLNQDLSLAQQEAQAYAARIRELEILNETLIQSNRALESSLRDVETKYNCSIEAVAILESELIATRNMLEESQRLKDDLRDARNEISVLSSRIENADKADSEKEPNAMKELVDQALMRVEILEQCLQNCGAIMKPFVTS